MSPLCSRWVRSSTTSRGRLRVARALGRARRRDYYPPPATSAVGVSALLLDLPHSVFSAASMAPMQQPSMDYSSRFAIPISLNSTIANAATHASPYLWRTSKSWRTQTRVLVPRASPLRSHHTPTCGYTCRRAQRRTCRRRSIRCCKRTLTWY